MNYQPIYKSIVPSGDYDFKIVKSVEGASKAGKPMLTLTVTIGDAANHKTTVFWRCLLDSGFLRNVAQGCGLLEVYESGKLEAHDFDNKEGTCLVEVEENALYEKNNTIKTFYAKKEEKSSSSTPDIIDNGIPF